MNAVADLAVDTLRNPKEVAQRIIGWHLDRQTLYFALFAVAAVISARKESADAALVKIGLAHSGSESQSADLSPDTSYAQLIEIFEDVPGGAGWTPSQFNATEISYENTG